MKKPINEEFKRMQKLAGLITENENVDNKDEDDDNDPNSFDINQD